MSTHTTYSDEQQEIIGATRLLVQKLHLEDERRDAVQEWKDALASVVAIQEVFIRAHEEVVARVEADRVTEAERFNAQYATTDRWVAVCKENIRLAEEALAAEGENFNRASLLLAATITETAPAHPLTGSDLRTVTELHREQTKIAS